MKMIKKVLAIALCVAVVACFGMSTMAVSAEEITTVEGVRWFPIPEDKQFDEAWEVECVKENCGCQRYNDDPAETTNYNFLDTVYGENGSLTITRNGNDKTDGIYWPRIRTLMYETPVEMSIETANTVYFNFDAAEGTSWNIMLAFNGISVKFSKVIADAAGKTGTVANSDGDGVGGHYEGSFNLQAALEEISKESGTESSVNAQALMNMSKTYVPSVSIFCVGEVGANLTMNELYITSADDADGAKCMFLDMGLLSGMGEEYYDLDEPVDEPDVDTDVDTDEGTTDEGATDEGTEPTEDDKKDEGNKDEGNAEGGDNTGLIIGIVIAAVVVIGGVAAFIIIKKKKAA